MIGWYNAESGTSFVVIIHKLSRTVKVLVDHHWSLADTVARDGLLNLLQVDLLAL